MMGIAKNGEPTTRVTFSLGPGGSCAFLQEGYNRIKNERKKSPKKITKIVFGFPTSSIIYFSLSERVLPD
jgi:hypothetical protein